MKRIAVARALALVLALSSAPSWAAQPEQGIKPDSKLGKALSELRTACRSDISKLCSGVTPGEGRILSCLESREDQLSPDCHASWTGMKARASARVDQMELSFRKSCGKDVDKYCSNVPSGRGRLLDCLSTHRGDLTQSCEKFHDDLNQELASLVG